MLAKDIMTALAVRCTPHTTLREAANLMLEHHCACLPVVKDFAADSEIIGQVCERDLVSRVVAEGLDPVMATVRLAMTMPANTVHDDATVEECVLRPASAERTVGSDRPAGAPVRHHHPG